MTVFPEPSFTQNRRNFHSCLRGVFCFHTQVAMGLCIGLHCCTVIYVNQISFPVNTASQVMSLRILWMHVHSSTSLKMRATIRVGIPLLWKKQIVNDGARYVYQNLHNSFHI